ncbi:pyruvate, phosphate dikinase [Humisphaera borealis]|uniref:Pyruvate, phosphate dikinase n=1 Tax=Humisphaera borealis TaxID=2807512 RepID=A0A7M2WRF9_9BACT|nr:pyruvate, phosphate dikinase [Humisphaera borealis]QOV87979.1 pyruvate, phosphate dikinase [Humisphaera borealis]
MAKTKTKPAKKPAAKPAAKSASKAAPKTAAKAGIKRVYFFGSGKAEGNVTMRDLLGGKGSNLADMTSAGLNVPPGFTITTATCKEYNDAGQKLPKGLLDEVKLHLARVEKATGKKFGDPKNPLLLACRSGAKDSMPGMMDTVLNIGLNDAVVAGMAALTKNDRFAYDSYRRLINMYGDTVMGVDHHHFEHELSAVKNAKGVELDTDLDADGLKDVVERYKKVYAEHVGSPFPTDPIEQLTLAIEAVFKSWMGDRAIRYREINEIRGLLGTAVNVQAMVFGNMGDDCATGVAFTRNPSTGENEFYGEFLVNAQGEDVVAGIRTPLECKSEMAKWSKKGWQELLEVKKKLEARYKDVQDFEFTIERGTFYMLQTRNGKRTAPAAVRIAIEMLKEKLIDEKTAILRVDPAALDQLLHPTFNPNFPKTIVAKGLPASPGAAVGKIAFTAEEAEERVGKGEQIILVRRETEPADIGGMHVSEGILTSTGGMTSHAAVVARGMGTPCVAGAGALQIDAKARTLVINGKTYTDKDVISLDGGTGDVMEGSVPTVEASLTGPFKQLMVLADKHRTLKVRTNADTPNDAEVARNFGAEGIGLTRTEHMFFDPERIQHMREMILATDIEARKKALAKLLPYQREDFIGIFKAMAGLPVTIRLLDPPLHEFLPHNERDQKVLADSLGLTLAQVKNRVDQLHESNPMLGHRGDRLAITYPEILEMQVRAILEAAVAVKKEKVKVLPEIMIPLAGTKEELDYLKKITVQTADAVFKEAGTKVEYMYGTMIEVPRAAITADEMAQTAEFFSFGTNDLTQMTFGYSRDDAGVFLPEYIKKEILPRDPFQSLDIGGVGKLIEMAVKLGRGTNKDLKCGICGEHGGDPKSVEFCHKVGLNYVSCSPFRVPIARLAAAQAAIKSANAATKKK